ncbi:MAG: AI-2E family transporter [Syntrophales bacterium]|nr:AI-2E family transporter [Syntrophales bacterium]
MKTQDNSGRHSGMIVAALGITLIFLLWISIEIVLLAFAGVLFAVFVKSIAGNAEKHLHVGHVWAFFITILLMAVVTGAGIILLARPIAGQSTELLNKIPVALEQLQQYITSLGLSQFISDLPGPIEYFSSRPEILTRITGIFSSTLGAAVTFAIILFLGLYMAFDPRLYIEGIVRLFPPDKREKALQVLGEAGRTLQWWLLGRFAAMLAVGVMITLGLWALGVPLALVLGIIAAILDFVPYIGPVLAFLPAFLIAILDSLNTAALVALLYFVVQSIESYLLSPIVQQKTVNIPPALTILSQVFLGIVAGALGVVLATPITAVMVVFVDRLYIEGVLERRRNPELPETITSPKDQGN